MTRWSLNPIFGSYGLILAVACGLALLLIIQPRFTRLSDRRRQVLLALRSLLIVVLAVAMLRPALVHTSTTPQSSLLIMLLDASRSMELPSTGSTSRWEAQSSALAAASPELRRLAKSMEVRAYAYADTLERLEVTDGQVALPAVAPGSQTDIGTAIHDSVTRELGRPIAGVILMGDGAQNAYSPRMDVQRAAQELARLDYPLFTITLGPTGDSTQARDVAVENLPERYTVFAKSELQVQGTVRIRGYVNRPIPVELLMEGPAEEMSRLGPVEVSVTGDNQVAPAAITLAPETPGEYKLTLRAATQPGELLTQNNELTAYLTVLEGGLRVLYVYGDLVGEQRVLRRSLDASPDIELDSLFVDRRNEQRWPIQLEEVLRGQKYDVLLLENVDTKALSRDAMQRLAERVGQGLGFMMIGGFNSFGPGGYRQTPLSDVLPIRMGRFERQDLDPRVAVSQDLHWWGELSLRPVRTHPVTTLAVDRGENERIWSSLPTLIGANRLELKPASQVLLESTSGYPLLVAGNYGRGRTLAFAGNTTRRWWQLGQQREHRRFWRQAILWLAQREDLNKNDVWIKLPQRRFFRGADVEFTTGAFDATGEPLEGVQLRVQSRRQGEAAEPIDLVEQDDAYQGTLTRVQEPGDYVLEVSALRGETTIGSAQASFQVMDRDLELSDPAADYALMAQLAATTEEAGGRALAPEELGRLLSDLRDAQRDLSIEVQNRWQLGDTDLDAWLLFLVLVSLASAEWVLRKRWGLV